MALIGNRKEFDEKVNYFDPEIKCIWTKTKTKAGTMYTSGCKIRYFTNYDINDKPYCPCCGYKIELKNAEI